VVLRKVMPLLSTHFQVFAVDLREQGRSTWTPGRYTLDDFGNDLVRFIDLVVQRPAIISGHSSGGTVAAWLSAFAKPGQVRASLWEDTPIFSSETNPSCGHSIHQGIGPVFALRNKWLGDQWSIGDFADMQKAFPVEIPAPIVKAFAGFSPASVDPPQGPPQNLREYDPEWGKAFVSGSATSSCDHENMVAHVRVPVLSPTTSARSTKRREPSPARSPICRCDALKNWLRRPGSRSPTARSRRCRIRCTNTPPAPTRAR